MAELESVSLDQPVHITGVDSPLEPEGGAIVAGHLTTHCLLYLCFQDDWQLEVCKVPVHQVKGYNG